MEPEDDAPEPSKPLPKEGERRIVEDADARGVPVVLQGGEAWYVPSLPLSPRGIRIGALIEALEDLEVEGATAQQGENAAAAALANATDDAAIEAAGKRLKGAAARRRKIDADLRVQHRELAYHALRCHYRVTRDEVGFLVTKRFWPDVVAALQGNDTEASKREMALDLFARLAKITGEEKGRADPVPLGSPTSSGGDAAS